MSYATDARDVRQSKGERRAKLRILLGVGAELALGVWTATVT